MAYQTFEIDGIPRIHQVRGSKEMDYLKRTPAACGKLEGWRKGRNKGHAAWLNQCPIGGKQFLFKIITS